MDIEEAEIEIRVEALVRIKDVAEDLVTNSRQYVFQPSTVAFTLVNGKLEDYSEVEVCGYARTAVGSLSEHFVARSFYRAEETWDDPDTPDWLKTLIANAEESAKKRGWAS